MAMVADRQGSQRPKAAINCRSAAATLVIGLAEARSRTADRSSSPVVIDQYGPIVWAAWSRRRSDRRLEIGSRNTLGYAAVTSNQ